MRVAFNFPPYVSGIFLAFSVLAALLTGFAPYHPLNPGSLQLLSGSMQIIAGVLLWPQVPSRVRVLCFLLAFLGFGCLFISPQTTSVASSLSKNQQLIAMLAAVGLLRSIPRPDSHDELPRGRKAVWQTLLGVHWLGSVINVSALALFADRMIDSDGKLKNFQGILLARGFAFAALWSPFFVSMGVALTFAPGANYLTLISWGLPFSQILLIGMIFQVNQTFKSEVDEFQGYPFRPASLAGPLALATSVLIGHALIPLVSIVTLITLVAPGYTLIANWNRHPLQVISQYVSKDLPRMGPEIVLFTAAGVFGTGVSSLVSEYSITLGDSHNQLLLVLAGLAVILLISSIGIHPVIGITLVGGVLAVANLPPNLLGMSFLMGWGLGILVNPISGIHLFLSSRYAFATRNVWHYNLKFIAVIYLFSCIWLYFVSCF